MALSRAKKLAIWRRDGWRCCFCKCRLVQYRPVKGVIPPPNGATVDHRKPKAEGGTNDWDNLRAMCYACNTGRGHEWLTKRQKELFALAAERVERDK